MKRKTFLIALFLVLFLKLGADVKNTYPSGFRMIQDSAWNLSKFYEIIQDDSGFLWAGTSNGLTCYDGYRFHEFQHSPEAPSSIPNNCVRYLTYLPEQSRIVACTDSGLSIFDIRKEVFCNLEEFSGERVSSAIVVRDTMFVTSDNELKYFRIPSDYDYSRIEVIKEESLSADCQISGARCMGGELYLCVKGGLVERKPDGSYEFMPITGIKDPKNDFVLDCCQDLRDSSILWIGSESGLIKYDRRSRISKTFLEDIPVKCFHFKNDLLMIGTDNGFYIKDTEDRFREYRHETEKSSSLPANVVWNIYETTSKEVYLATDHGMCLVQLSDLWTEIKLNDITDSSEGMDIELLDKDKDGNIYLGGNNGLLVLDSLFQYKKWYHADRGVKRERISHHKVHSLLHDGESTWIASDGGLDLLDRRTGFVSKYQMHLGKGKTPTNWIYSLAIDPYDRMWVATYEGLYCISHLKAQARKSDPVLEAEVYVDGVLFNSLFLQGNNLYALADDIYVIDVESLDYQRLGVSTDGYIYSLTGDGQNVWFAQGEKIYTLNPDNQLQLLHEFNSYVKDVAFANGRLYALMERSVAVYDTEAQFWRHYALEENSVLTMCVAEGLPVLFGGVDKMLAFYSENSSQAREKMAPVMTDLIIKNSSIRAGEIYDGQLILPERISYAKDICLNYSENSFALEFSCLNYKTSDNYYAYRLKGLDDDFQYTTRNQATFINVPAGNYTFEVYNISPGGVPISDVTTLDVKIRPVFYRTTMAYVIYALLLVAVIFFILKFARTSQKLKIEHIERTKAMEVVQLKTDFLSNISHEFKNPLSVILGLLGKIINQESDAMRTKELSDIRKNAERMHYLLDKMMEYNESTERKLFFPSAASVQKLAKECFDGFQEAFREKELNTRFVSDDIKYIFMIDRVQMQTVFQNLLSNAIKFTPKGGSILMSVNILEETSEILKVEICVSDTGSGISQEELPFIFNRYYMAPSNKEVNINGTGIGLYLVKNIIEKHNGAIHVDSVPGEGTTFKVVLSTIKSDSFLLRPHEGERVEQTLHNLSHVWQHDRKPRILLAEDNQDIRDFITASLKDDYTILPAVDGNEGLAVLEKEKIDLIISDVAMPGMDGLTMCKYVRASLQTAFIPIIILTGKTDSETRLKSCEYADLLIAKPFSLSYLNSSIIQLLVKHEHYLAKIKEQKVLNVKVDELESPDEVFLKEIISVIEAHIDDPDFTTTRLYEETHYSSKQIYRKIKQLCGMTIVELIRDIRLKKAALYLQQGKLSVTEIMYMVGFTTASYFSKCFKEKYGTTPSEYSKQNFESEG